MDHEFGITPSEPDHVQDLSHRPLLPSWNNLQPVNASPPLTSPSLPSSSPTFSISSPYSPHSKTRWQLTQSEPSLATYMSNEEDLFSTPTKSSLYGERRNTLHVDIPAKAIGHAEGVRDEDPFLIPSLPESALEALGNRGNDSELARYKITPALGRTLSTEDDEARRGRSRHRSPAEENILHFTPRQGLIQQAADPKSLHAPSCTSMIVVIDSLLGMLC
jgi:hypothetical protein